MHWQGGWRCRGRQLLLPPICASRRASQPVEKPLASDIRTFSIFYFGKAEGDGDEEREEELAATFFDSLLGRERLRRFADGDRNVAAPCRPRAAAGPEFNLDTEIGTADDTDGQALAGDSDLTRTGNSGGNNGDHKFLHP